MFSLKFLLEFLQNTYSASVWNELRNIKSRELDIEKCLQISTSASEEVSEPITVFQENGHEYHGRLKAGLKHDPNATLYYENLKYQGPFVNDMKHGMGGSITDNNSSYVFDGNFVNDKKEGEGQLFIQHFGKANKTEKYNGYFKND